MQVRQIAVLVAGGLAVAALAAGAAFAGQAPDSTVPKGQQVVQDVVVRQTTAVPENRDLVVQSTTVVPMPQPAQQPVEAAEVPAPLAADEPTTEPVTDPAAPTHPPFIPSNPGETAPAPPPPAPMCAVTGPDGRLVLVPPGPDGLCP